MANSSQQDVVAEVKAALDIAEVISGYLDLKPAGSGRFKSLCPFHQEKTPSFHVARDRQTFHCFGCGKGGDLFTFVQEIEGLGFREALESLADRAGIRIEGLQGWNKNADDQRTQVMKLAAFAARFYHETLNKEAGDSRGRDYLASRELKPDTVARFGLGYVPEGWQHVIDAARAEGFRDATLEASGLAKRGSRGLYDFFRDRLIFPIRDGSGKVVAFGGRALGDDPAKYINSPESSVYKKGRVLYGLGEARQALRSANEAIVVEGYFDLLRCVDAGIENVVATCGTALTADQAVVLRRNVEKVLVVFDGDDAGIRAAMRSIGVLAGAGLTVRAMLLPDGLDPDDFIRESGPEAFRRLAADAPDFVRFYVRMNPGRRGTIEGRGTIAKELFAILVHIDPLGREEYVKELARELGLDVFRCQEEFHRYLRDGRGRSDLEHKADQPREAVDSHERDFIGIVLAHPALLKEACDAALGLELPVTPALEVLGALAARSPVEVLHHLESEGAKQLYSAAASGENTWGERAGEVVRERILRFQKDALVLKRVRVSEEIHRAQRLHDDPAMDELAIEKIDIDRQIERLGAA